ncbi:MAG: tape measure protein [Pseudomonadota bacterium]
MADGTLDYRFKIDIPTGPIEDGTRKLERLEKELQKLKQPGKIKALESEITSFGKHHDTLAHRIRGMFGQVGHSFNYAKTEGKELLEIFGVIAAFEFAHKVVEGLYEIGSEALKAAAAAERMDLSFDLSLGAEGGKEMVEFLDRISGKTEFTDDQLKGWGKELLNAGVAAEELDKFMAAGLDVAAKSPDKLEGMSRAMQALSRASLTGTVDARQLRGLSIGVEQLKTLPKFAHMSIAQLKKEMTDGKITKDDLLSIIAGPDKILGDLGIRAGKTMEARMLHLRHIPEEIFQKLAKTEAFDRLGGAIDRVLQKLDPEGPVAKKVFAALESVLGTFADMVDSIDFDAVATAIVDDVIPAIKTMIGAVKPFLDFTLDVINGFHRMYNLVNAKGEFNPYNEGNLYRGGKSQAAGLAQLKLLAGGGDKKTIDLGGGTKAYHDKFHMVGEAGGDGAAEGLNKSRPQVKQAASDMGGAAIDAIKEKTKTHSPSVVFEDIGGMVSAGFAMGIRGGADDVASAVDGMMRVPAAAPAAAAGGGGVSLVIERIEVHAGGHGQAAMEEAARAFTTTLRPLLTGLLEEVAAEMGARA